MLHDTLYTGQGENYCSGSCQAAWFTMPVAAVLQMVDEIIEYTTKININNPFDSHEK